MESKTQVEKLKLLPVDVYFKKNIRRFLTEASLHALKYIEDAQRSIWERVYYFISFAIAFTAGLYMAFYFMERWQSTPVIIGISSKSTSINELPFPAVIFCNMNKALASKVKDINPDTPEYAMLQRICFQNYNFTGYKNFKPRFKDDQLSKFQINVAQTCNDMIIYCKFGTNEEPCSNLFREILLDEGICCVFNRLHPFFLYKVNYKFVRDYTSLNGRSSLPVNWNLETGYQKPLPKDYYPRKAAGLGVSLGLTVVLNAKLDEYYCSSTNGPGFKFLLYNPIDAPAIKEIGLPLMAGHQTRISINTKLIESQHTLRSIKPKDRQCYFSNEKKLVAFKYYTRRYCEMECDVHQMLRHCNCVSYHMPKMYLNTTNCNLSDMECVVHTERLTTDPRDIKCKKECLAGCYDILYFPDMSVTPFTKKNFSVQYPFFRNISKKIMPENLALVQIYYRDNYLRSNTKLPYTGVTEFLSQTGGIMGLMVGFSVVSIIELVYFILLKPFLDMMLKRNPSKFETKDDDGGFSKDKFHPQMLFKRRKNIDSRILNWDKKEIKKHRNDKY